MKNHKEQFLLKAKDQIKPMPMLKTKTKQLKLFKTSRGVGK